MKVKRKYKFYYEKETMCHHCNGTGIIEYLKPCNVPISDCCGGCYETCYCEKCDGDGYIMKEKTLKELIYKFKKNRKCIK